MFKDTQAPKHQGDGLVAQVTLMSHLAAAISSSKRFSSSKEA